ncbi:UDP-N-acetylmuramate:L-alanyl-gamma-D-glutamyl-meso-diaminopimelate ligase [Parathalassolituus penaei]|uniref:UDP-N-acetylmuramate--L-alanyl-gamma-D-glutamyl-meso-2,6-diaminoheptandioate ligase n=1 Tax=Parathalassolituus penaei TaxID=2997323 RepID=A0A9X3IR44_9GAMM|nr:UDP-N-acetylmuramate:L-alanyl-gamma-D-glutamyl-meso-diaminopimelate ligase [Parathalassolituus penaei]MCY0964461.1 UDP-N-acetylmuramate:L-alanyl-gamma-D-glutamyl-meso-diaminopimelate ligase [Parathalassolituus penaei]
MQDTKRLHILGICGTFMGSLAQLARELGHQVSGSDAGVYPPMCDQLAAAGIELTSGYDPSGIPEDVDEVIIGNAMSRGNPSVEYVLERGIPYTSGPEWLRREVLQSRWVLAVAGTHGKTTTSSMVAWILEDVGMAPGFLIGGVPGNFPTSARLGQTHFFVIEADEYDTAFFDKRSKFLHYLPRTLIANNLEYDHADIFPDLEAIERQFQHLMRLVPASGRVVLPAGEAALERVLDKGRWFDVERFGAEQDWSYQLLAADGSAFAFCYQGGGQAEVRWGLTGLHNVRNACAAILAARHVGIHPAQAAKALCDFRAARRRMELLADHDGIRVYDDFAHHPTAIATTLEGFRASLAAGTRVLAVLEPRSNTMKAGVHKDSLATSVAAADHSLWLQPSGLGWSLQQVADACGGECLETAEAVLASLKAQTQPGDQVIFMSNGGFAGLPARFAEWIANGRPL